MFNPQEAAAQHQDEQAIGSAALAALLQEQVEDPASGLQAASIQIMNEAKRKLKLELAQIARVLDWSEPNIAFYGETNAGKSTLIEALRLLFQSSGDRPGEAIGDGSPDYTREATSYPCQSGETHFNLVDVPGIEGNEAKVADAIQDAVHRAHAVFYVTADARPPQGGDEPLGGSAGRVGTLEKIRHQLRPQAKVWAIYNKKVTNPRQIGATLANEDERQSLSEGDNSLDAKMREALGDHYQGHIILSAMPAFLALADDLSQDSRFVAQRAKFLAKMSAEAIREVSNLAQLKDTILGNVPSVEQIAEANAGKLVPPIEDAVAHLEAQAAQKFGNPAQELQEALAKLEPKLEEIGQDAWKEIDRLSHHVVDGCIMRIRESMMKAIDKGISGDAALKASFDEATEAEKNQLPKVVDERFKSAIDRTVRKCQAELKMLDLDLQDSKAFESAAFRASFFYDFEADTKSGINWTGLGVSVGTLLFTTGPVAIAGLALGVLNNIWKFFSGNHHKGEQKRALNKALDELKPKIQIDVLKAMEVIEKDLQSRVWATKARLTAMERKFNKGNQRLSQLSAALKGAIADISGLVAYAQHIGMTASHPASSHMRVYPMNATTHSDDIGDVLTFLEAGQQLGVAIPSHLRDKLARLGAASSGKLKVALVGGFSEGKTSLAAAWLGMLPDDMKISQGESSNAVTVYDAGDAVELVDTPGLFGFKQSDVGDGTAEKYKEMTRKYVSEANLVLYVLNPSNPLKESHKDELNWLFRELGLLSRTVFVIGRFDMVADVEDDAEYAHHLAIKQANIHARLHDLIGLTEQERDGLSIVGVAANPFDQGIANWLEQPEDYARLSHIEDLRAATKAKVDAVGGAQEAQRQTCAVILRDVTDRLLAPAREAAEESERAAAHADRQAQREKPLLDRYKDDAKAAQIALSDEVSTYFSDLIVEATHTGMDDFADFFTRKIGLDGALVNASISKAFAEQLGPVSRQLVTMSADFVSSNEAGVAAVQKLGSMVGKFKGSVSNATILKARDWVMPALKFKPWGATKLANGLNGALGAVGLAAEAWSALADMKKNRDFGITRDAIIKDLREQQAALLGEINASDFVSTHFPQIDAMHALFEALKAALEQAVERNRQTREWAAQAGLLSLRFGGVSASVAGEGVIIDA